MFKLNIPIATFVRIFVLAAFLVIALQSQMSAANYTNCTITNNTNQWITQFYFKYSSSNNWGRSFVSTGALKSRHYISSKYIAGYNYDFKVVFYTGSKTTTREYRNIYLSGQKQIWFDYKNGDFWINYR